MNQVIDHYDTVQAELRDLLIEKLDQYGIGRYEKHSDQFNYWMCFSDVYRKTLRLERLTMQSLFANDALATKNAAREKLISDYKDIANYAIMAAQILEKKNEN